METFLFVRVDGVYCRDQIGWEFSFCATLATTSRVSTNFRSRLEIFAVSAKSFRFIKSVCETRKIFQFPLRCFTPLYYRRRWRACGLNWQTSSDKNFGFCVDWLRNSDRLNRLTNMMRQTLFALLVENFSDNLWTGVKINNEKRIGEKWSDSISFFHLFTPSDVASNQCLIA